MPLASAGCRFESTAPACAGNVPIHLLRLLVPGLLWSHDDSKLDFHRFLLLGQANERDCSTESRDDALVTAHTRLWRTGFTIQSKGCQRGHSHPASGGPPIETIARGFVASVSFAQLWVSVSCGFCLVRLSRMVVTPAKRSYPLGSEAPAFAATSLGDDRREAGRVHSSRIFVMGLGCTLVRNRHPGFQRQSLR